LAPGNLITKGFIMSTAVRSLAGFALVVASIVVAVPTPLAAQPLTQSPLGSTPLGTPAAAPIGGAPSAVGQPESAQAACIDLATGVLREVMNTPGKGIPTKLLAEAQGLVIVPDMVKGGFVVGVKHGKGVAVVRDANGNWGLPQFVTINGASLGWQAGIQATDLILVFRTQKGVQGLLSGKFTIGADAAAAAGPVGRDVQAATDARLKAEILSYSRSRGLFAGVSLDGSSLRMENAETQLFYQPPAGTPPGQALPAPPAAARLLEEIARYSRPAAVAAPGVVAEAGNLAPVDPRVVQQSLAAASQRLAALVDERWKAYLALPPETYGGQQVPSLEGLNQALARYRAIAADPQYSALSSRPEFADTLRSLEQLISTIPNSTINLPPPPVR
jgi:lipid-binding SYLF domain-containing protein